MAAVDWWQRKSSSWAKTDWSNEVVAHLKVEERAQRPGFLPDPAVSRAPWVLFALCGARVPARLTRDRVLGADKPVVRCSDEANTCMEENHSASSHRHSPWTTPE